MYASSCQNVARSHQRSRLLPLKVVKAKRIRTHLGNAHAKGVRPVQWAPESSAIGKNLLSDDLITGKYLYAREPEYIKRRDSSSKHISFIPIFTLTRTVS